MKPTATVPGLYFTAVPRPVEPSPLRSDVAGFIGRTRRGPVGQATRVEGWRDYLRLFGGLQADAATTYAIRGFFENEGQVAWIVRLGGYADEQAQQDGAAQTTWDIRKLSDGRPWTELPPSAFLFASYRIEGTSPGAWANGTRVSINYRRDGLRRNESSGKQDRPLGTAEVDLIVQAPNEPIEYLNGIAVDTMNSPDNLAREIAVRSRLIRLIPLEQASASQQPAPEPRQLRWELVLSGGQDVDLKLPEIGQALKQEYFTATRKLGDEGEVAIVAAPGLYEDLKDADDQREILVALIEQAEELRDRLVLIDLPNDNQDPDVALKQLEETLDWVTTLRYATDDRASRAAAIYHPRLSVPDALGGISRPLRNVPPSGHVAGVISRLDRDRGAHHTPANAPIFEAVDVTQRFDAVQQERCNSFGVNLLRCFAGDGLKVWGGRTLNLETERRFVAHRRLIHRLVRAIRRVAEPLVFDINGPELRLALVRSITAMLLEAWHAGALKGARPEEAFRVVCDEKLNPPEEIDLGRVHCLIEVAPAVPMEFIQLRVALSAEGRLEVFES